MIRFVQILLAKDRLKNMVEASNEKEIYGESFCPTHKAIRPGSRRARLREMFTAVQAPGYPAALLLFSLLLTFAQAATLSEEEIHVSFAESHSSASESAKRRVGRMLRLRIPLSLPCINAAASNSRSVVQLTVINHVCVFPDPRRDRLPEWTRQETGSVTTAQVSAFSSPSFRI